MELVVKRGKNLSIRQIQKWNKTRLEDWKEESPLNLKNRENYADDIFFILYNKNKEVLSSGRLKPVKIKFMGKEYNILGGSDLISEIKGKGYGKRVKKAQMRYSRLKNKTMIGFCSKENSPFYKKCGLKIAKDMVNRFVCLKQKEENEDDDVTFLEGKDKFLTKFLKNPNEKVIIPIPHW